MYLEGPKEKTPPLGYCSRCMVVGEWWRPAMATVAGTGYCADCVLSDDDPTGLVARKSEGTGSPPSDVVQWTKQELLKRRTD